MNTTNKAPKSVAGSGNRPMLRIRNGQFLDWVYVDEIVRIEGDVNYCSIFLSTGKVHLMALTLKKMAARLPDFWRSHRKHLVNQQYLSTVRRVSISETFAILSTGDTIPVSRRVLRKLLEKQNSGN